MLYDLSVCLDKFSVHPDCSPEGVARAAGPPPEAALLLAHHHLLPPHGRHLGRRGRHARGRGRDGGRGVGAEPGTGTISPYLP